MIIEAALKLQDGIEQDALQDIGSNMASAYSTEQDTLQEMGSTGTCSTQDDDLPPLVHKGTRNSCKNSGEKKSQIVENCPSQGEKREFKKKKEIRFT